MDEIKTYLPLSNLIHLSRDNDIPMINREASEKYLYTIQGYLDSNYDESGRYIGSIDDAEIVRQHASVVKPIQDFVEMLK